MSAIGARPTSSSPRARPRPSTGWTPRIGNRSEETNSPETCSAAPWPVRLKLEGRWMAIPARVRLPSRQSRKFGYGTDPLAKFGLLSWKVTRRSGSGYGSGSSSTPSMIENSAVLAPMPSARVSSATAVKPGLRRSTRAPCRTSATRSSNRDTPRASRHSSFTRLTPPRSSRARRSASTRGSPAATCFSICLSRWKASSSSSSRSTARLRRSARARNARSRSMMAPYAFSSTCATAAASLRQALSSISSCLRPPRVSA